MSFLILFHRYIGRDLIGKPVRTSLTVLGVALGIGVVVAVQLSNQRAIGSFTESLSILSGQADLQIHANGLPFDEQIISRLEWFWDEGRMTALVEGRAALPNGDSVRIYGIDLLADSPFRSYIDSQGRDVTLRLTETEFLELLSEPDRVILPLSLARRLDLDQGERLPLLVGETRRWTRVGAVLSDTGAARAFGGNLLFMDIAAAQLLLGKLGRLDRMDLRLDQPTKLDAVTQRISSLLPPGLNVSPPESLQAEGDRMLRAFRFNLTALSYLALIVGVILVYNTLNIAVVRRVQEIASLRTLGTSRRTVMGLFLGEAVILGLAGAGVGIWVGTALATGAQVLVSQTIESLYTGISSRSFTGDYGTASYLFILGSGVLLGAASGAIPAWRATTVEPVVVLRRGFLTSQRSRRYGGHALAGLLVFAGAWLLAQGPAWQGLPVLAYLSAVLQITGFALLAPWLAGTALSWLARLGRRLPVEARLARQSVEGGLGRLLVAVVSLMISCAMLVGVATMVGSFRETVIAWIDQTLVADLYVKAAGAGANDWQSTLSEQSVAVIAKVPGVEAVGRFRGRSIRFRGQQVTLAGGDFQVLARHGNLIFVDGRSTAQVVAAIADRPAVMVSEPLSLKRGIGRGDWLELPTPAGPKRLQVEAIYYDYSSERGIIVMDRPLYLSLFDDTGSTSVSVYLAEGSQPEPLRREISAAVSGAQLQIFANSELRKEALRVFDQTFQVTYGLEFIAIVVAVLGVTNTLAALILERRGEVALLQFLGAARSQIRRMALFESLLVGALGVFLGSGLGLSLSLLLIYVINRQSFGWTIQFDLPGVFLCFALGTVLLSTLFSGLYPAWVAARTDPIRSLRTE